MNLGKFKTLLFLRKFLPKLNKILGQKLEKKVACFMLSFVKLCDPS